MKPGQSFLVERTSDWKAIRAWTKAHGFEVRGARDIHPQTGKRCHRLWLVAYPAPEQPAPLKPVAAKPEAFKNGPNSENGEKPKKPLMSAPLAGR
jgi:hypothetical protein